MEDQNFKNLLPKKFDFHQILKIHEFYLENPQTFVVVFVLQCIQRENVREDRREAP